MTINLREERLNRGLSAAQAAKAMKLPSESGAQVLLNAENGSKPRPETAFKIANFYGYKPTEIWPLDQKARAA